MAENETITDIIKKIRAEADRIEESARGSLKTGESWPGRPFTESDLESALDLAETKRKEADRLEAALGREKSTAEKSSAVGNAAKLREAVEACLHAFQTTDWTTLGTSGRVVDLIQRCKSALAKPPRNCDVGDAHDWEERFGDECDKGHICQDCPVYKAKRGFDKGARCEYIWAQMLYEKGGAE